MAGGQWETPLRVQKITLGVLLCLSGCGPPVIIGPDMAQRRFVNFVPRPLQPSNCGTPDRYKDCHPGGRRRVAVAQARAYVTIEEVGGAPAQASNDLPPGE